MRRRRRSRHRRSLGNFERVYTLTEESVDAGKVGRCARALLQLTEAAYEEGLMQVVSDIHDRRAARDSVINAEKKFLKRCTSQDDKRHSSPETAKTTIK